jgi:hypothetical protein
MTRVLRIGNCSGFYGDRLSAMREMLLGGELDVLTGDYLAELTMLILGRDRMKDPALGYARTFVKQAEDCLGLAVENRVRIVANAGGLNPAGLADRLREVAAGLGLDVRVAHVEGDDLLDRADDLGLADSELGKPLTANAYLGAFGIAAALDAGADVVVTGRVTDASLVVGPAIARFGWTRTSYDALAGATVAGHVIECGTQATGGNFSGFFTAGLPQDRRPLGFPVAEVDAEGSSVITKHEGTGGLVTVDTVTAQLMYEIQTQTYLGPDVAADLTSIELHQDTPDRVRISGVVGSPPPAQLKACLNFLGGWRNSVEFLLTSPDVDAKHEWVHDQLEAAWSERDRPAVVHWSRTAPPVPNASNQELAYSLLRCTVLDPSPEVAGKGLTGPAVELALASYPGFTLSGAPSPASPYGIYRAAYVDRAEVQEVVVHADGSREPIAPSVTEPAGRSREVPPTVDTWPHPARKPAREGWLGAAALPRSVEAGGRTSGVQLGGFVHARSGDKGGDANLGLWVAHDGSDKYDARVEWLLGFVTPTRIRELVPEARGLDVEVHPLPNLGGVNVLLHGLLGDGVAASTRIDPQAKALGEWVRSRLVEIPEELR